MFLEHLLLPRNPSDSARVHAPVKVMNEKSVEPTNLASFKDVNTKMGGAAGALHSAQTVNGAAETGPHTLHPAPYTLHSAPHTLHPTPCTLNPTP